MVNKKNTRNEKKGKKNEQAEQVEKPNKTLKLKQTQLNSSRTTRSNRRREGSETSTHDHTAASDTNDKHDMYLLSLDDDENLTRKDKARRKVLLEEQQKSMQEITAKLSKDQTAEGDIASDNEDPGHEESDEEDDETIPGPVDLDHYSLPHRKLEKKARAEQKLAAEKLAAEKLAAEKLAAEKLAADELAATAGVEPMDASGPDEEGPGKRGAVSPPDGEPLAKRAKDADQQDGTGQHMETDQQNESEQPKETDQQNESEQPKEAEEPPEQFNDVDKKALDATIKRFKHDGCRVIVYNPFNWMLANGNVVRYLHMKNAAELFQVVDGPFGNDFLKPFREELELDHFGAGPIKNMQLQKIFDHFLQLYPLVTVNGIPCKLPLSEKKFPKRDTDPTRWLASYTAVVVAVIRYFPEYMGEYNGAIAFEKLGDREHFGEFRSEDIQRGVTIVRFSCGRITKKAKKTKEWNKDQEQGTVTGKPLRYLTNAQCQDAANIMDLGSTNVKPSEEFGRKFQDYQVALILVSTKTTDEQKEELLEDLDTDFASAVASRTKKDSEGTHERPRLKQVDMQTVVRTLGSQASVAWPQQSDILAMSGEPRDDLIQRTIGTEETLEGYQQPDEDEPALREPKGALLAEPREYTQEQRQKYLNENAKQHSSRLTLMKYEDAAAAIGIKLPEPPIVDPALRNTDLGAYLKAIRPYAEPEFIPGLRLKHHQVDGIASMLEIEQSKLPGVILSDEMGLGKTISCLSLLLAGHKRDLELGHNHIDGSKRYRPTIIATPSAAMAAWKNDRKNFFSDKIKMIIWYGSKMNALDTDKSFVIGSSVDSLRAELKKYPTSDPKSSLVIILTSITTFARRSTLPPTAQNDPSLGSNDTVIAPYESTEDDDEVVSRNRDYKLYTPTIAGLAQRIIVDEAHGVKGTGTLAQAAILKNKFDKKILITGTPIKNRASDLGGLLTVLCDGPDFADPFAVQDAEDRLARDRRKAEYKDLYTDSDDEGDGETSSQEEELEEPQKFLEHMNLTGLSYYQAMAHEVRKWNQCDFKEKLTRTYCRNILWVLDPRRFLTLTLETPGTIVDAETGSLVLPPVLGTILIKRGKGTKCQVGPYELSVGEDIPIPHVYVVELNPTYAQKNILREINKEEIVKLGRKGGSVEYFDKAKRGSDESRTGFGTTAVRRMVMSSWNGILENIYQNCNAGKEMLDIIRRNSGTHEEFWFELTKSKVWHQYHNDRAADARQQCILSGKKLHVMNRIDRWVLEDRKKLILYFNWPHNLSDMANTLKTLGIPFSLVTADQDTTSRESAVANFTGLAGPNILLTSLRVAAVSLNLKEASRLIFCDFPPSASECLQGLARAVRIGAKEECIVEILLMRHSIDHIIAGAMENKYAPIIAGQAGVDPSDDEIEEEMKRNHVDPTLWSQKKDLYKNRLVDAISRDMFKRVFGTRRSFSKWTDKNIELTAKQCDAELKGVAIDSKEVELLKEEYKHSIAAAQTERAMDVGKAYEIVAVDGNLRPDELKAFVRSPKLQELMREDKTKQAMEALKSGGKAAKKRKVDTDDAPDRSQGSPTPSARVSTVLASRNNPKGSGKTKGSGKANP